ncbi:MAG: hypothetical protein K0Q95_3294 [Bacteroidota bacterium]|jgi:hypothetical protein|nr:hypothetical protein [Bacteroidota bacterium]
MKKSILFIYSLLFLSLSISAQSFQWAKREGDRTNGRTVAVDAVGNSYVAGTIYANTMVGTQTLNLVDGSGFLAKYDNTGAFVWAIQMDSVEIFDIEANGTDVVVSGRYQSGAMIGSTALAGGTGWDGYVAKFNSSGTLTWVKTLNNPATYESINAIDMDAAGNIYATGTYRGNTAMYGTTTFAGNFASESMLLMKLDPAGSIVWSRTVTSDDGGASGFAVEVAPSGDIYVMSGADGDSLYYGSMLYNSGSYPAELLVHYNNAGTALDMAEINHIYQDNVTDMTVDAMGNVYTLQTNYLMSFSISKFTSALDTTWTIADGGGGHLSVRDIMVLPSGEIVVYGTVDEDATFSGNTVYDYGGSNGFLAKYTSGGVFSSIEVMPGSLFAGGADQDASGDIYITGNMNDSASFDGINLTGNNTDAMFLARYSLTTGISTYEKSEISVYPNPASSLVNCDLSALKGKSVITLYNPMGQKVYEKEEQQGVAKLNMSEMASGVYLLQITNNNQSLTSRIIKN